MKRILMCLLLICGFAAISPIYSMANEDGLDFSYLTVDNSNHVTSIEIVSGVTGGMGLRLCAPVLFRFGVG